MSQAGLRWLRKVVCEESDTHSRLQSLRLPLQSGYPSLLLSPTRLGSTTLAQLLRQPDMSYAHLPNRNDSLTEEVVQQVEIEMKYAGYISRQQAEVERFRDLEGKQIPQWMDYNQVPSLRTEARQKFNEVRPATLGQAARISGVSPADVSLVMIWMKRGPRGGSKECTLS